MLRDDPKPAARLTIALIFAALLSTAFAHVTKTAGGDAYQLTVGYVGAPLYVGEVEQVELVATDAAGEPVVGLEASLRAEVIGPGGATLELRLRAVHGTPGLYLADFRPMAVGNYDVRLFGFVGEHAFDEVFSGVDIAHADPVVTDPADISLP